MAAERIVSPGVFTRESDLSFLQQGVGQIAGAFIGPTTKGPAFIPTIVRSQTDLENVFGLPDGTSFLNDTVANYLNQSGQATVVRVLGLGGYDVQEAVVYASGSNGFHLYGILHPSNIASGSSITAATGSGATTASFTVQVNSGGPFTGSNLTINAASDNYIGKFFGFKPSSTNGAYIYGLFPEALTAAGTGVTIGVVTSSNALYLTGSTYGVYSHASTPWIQSQTLGGTKFNLFKVHTLADGTNANKTYRVAIVGPQKAIPSGSAYATFGMELHKYEGTIGQETLVQSWTGLNLNPASPNYIARVIGNSAPITDPNTSERYFEGEFPNTQNYIRVEMSENIGNLSLDAVPFGFAQLQTPFSYGVVNAIATASIVPTFISSSWKTTGGVRGYVAGTTSYDENEYYGFVYDNTENTLNTNMSLLAPLPSGAAQIGAAFSLENLGNSEIQIPNTSTFVNAGDFLDPTKKVANRLTFLVPFQGGFDGYNPARVINMFDGITATNTQGFDLSTAVAEGSIAYKKAIDAVANPESYDINLLVLPGVVHSLHSYIADYAVTVCESRGDCFYIMDLVGPDASTGTAVQEAASLDTSYAAAYYPWVKSRISSLNQIKFVPPSVVLPEVYGYSDNVAAEWFAPAGLNRGGIPGAVGVRSRVSQVDRDSLYEGKVNPIAQFTGQGVCVWGQKTLQRRPSALDRVNVRRLLITVKKFIASSSRYLVFEQNTDATRRRFINIASPFLSSIQERSGLYSFRVVMDETNNTPDVIDRNILAGSIYLQPTKTAEFIKLDFNILPTGATFAG